MLDLQGRERFGDWMQTFSGRMFFPLDPREDEIDIIDIAHHLSMLCRYCGAVREFYSVAEHSVRASQIVAPEHALWTLMHDASEAYMIDLPMPIKRCPEIGEPYTLHEKFLQRVICAKFGLPRAEPPEVKEADNVMLMTERRDLMATPPRKWHEWATPLPERIYPWPPVTAESRFMDRFSQLTKPVTVAS